MYKLFTNWKKDVSPEIVLRVHEAQVRQLYLHTWGGLGGIMLIMVLVCAALWDAVAHAKLLAWAGALVLLSLARGAQLIAFTRRDPGGQAIYPWAKVHVAGVIGSGSMWALASVFLWPAGSPVHQMIWPICIVALAASAVAKYCAWVPAYLPYMLLLMVPISLRMFVEGGPVYTILGILGLVFTAILAYTGNQMHNASLRALVFGIGNEALSGRLREEVQERARSQEELELRNGELERLNADLREIKCRLETANDELAGALRNIKQLRGMLPICSSCKKIRNDQGYWEQLEAYIRDHTEAEFSHSICPECARRLYPDIMADRP